MVDWKPQCPMKKTTPLLGHEPFRHCPMNNTLSSAQMIQPLNKMIRIFATAQSFPRPHMAIRRASQQIQNTKSSSKELILAGRVSTDFKSLITQENAKKWRDMSTGERVVFATKQTSYTGVILAGLGISGEERVG